MAEVMNLNIETVLRKKITAYGEDFGRSLSSGSEEDAALAEAVFGESSEEYDCKQSDDDSPRSGRMLEAQKRAVNVASGDQITDDPALPETSGVPETSNITFNASHAASDGTPEASHAARSAFRRKPTNARAGARDEAPRPPPMPRHRCVLVAKCLTNSDASSGRIILPRVAVESNLPFVTAYRHYALTVRDSTGCRYEFVIKSWANGTEHRRVFVLEQAGDFLRTHCVGVGDTVGICTDESGELVVEANTEAVRHATVSPKYGALALAPPPPGTASAPVPLAATMSGRCARSVHCAKPAGHPGFCSGPKAASMVGYAGNGINRAKAFRRKTAAAGAVAVPGGGGGGGGALNDPHSSIMERTGTAAGMATGADEYSSDETAMTTAGGMLALSETGSHHKLLPPGLHTIAYIPSGVHLCKTLTAYDLSSRRIILPADDVEYGVPNATASDIFTMPAVDESQVWQFPTMRAWESVAGRRGYLLEDVSDFLTCRAARPGDVLAVYREADLKPPRIEVRIASTHQHNDNDDENEAEEEAMEEAGATHARSIEGEEGAMQHHHSEKLRYPKTQNPTPAATATAIGTTTTTTTTTTTEITPGGEGPGPSACLTFADMPVLLHPPVQDHWSQHHMGSSTATTPRLGAMSCQRTGGCTKTAGHQGFCSGHKGFKRRDGGASLSGSGGGISAHGRQHPFRQHRLATVRGAREAYYDSEERWGSDDDDYTPCFKRQRRGGASSASTPRAAAAAAHDPLLSLLSLLDS